MINVENDLDWHYAMISKHRIHRYLR
jgi:hypothetical protein